jgi:hypothetical protein
MYPVLIPLPENRDWNISPFGPLFLELFGMMVRLGLARPHVQPCPRKLSCELRSVSYGQTETLVCSKLAACGPLLYT